MLEVVGIIDSIPDSDVDLPGKEEVVELVFNSQERWGVEARRFEAKIDIGPEAECFLRSGTVEDDALHPRFARDGSHHFLQFVFGDTVFHYGVIMRLPRFS